MIKQRVIETNEGIQDGLTVEIFDSFARGMRDKGWNNVDSFIKAGITKGNALEIGPGPGYVGLEWLKKTEGTTVTGCEISGEMIRLAQKNAAEYGLEARTSYVLGNCMQMPFADASFDAVFSNGSMHEWEDPKRVFNEIARVLKPGGIYCVDDMRRDVSPLIKWPIYLSTKPKEIRPGFLTSLYAAYTVPEISSLINQTALRGASIRREFFGLMIQGIKA
jgi:ubiquinone/menaquinone biosynthesis C-methylase UbiE